MTVVVYLKTNIKLNNMSKILTAKEYLIISDEFETLETREQEEAVTKAMIEFAKLHVEAALKAADQNASVEIIDYDELDNHPIYSLDSKSILNAYPLTNIK